MPRQPSPEQIIVGHRAALALVRSRVVNYAKTAWIAQGSYRDADIDRLVSLIVPRVQAGQVQTANLTSSYIATLATVRRGKLIKPQPINRLAVTGGRGTPAEDVYRRPAIEMYNALSGGAVFQVAKEMGLNRLTSLVATDMQMSQVRQADASYQSIGAKKYERILGDGGKDGNCALCIIASTQQYWVGDLSPIHPGCSCSTDEISAENPWDVDAKAQLLEETHARVEQATGREADRSGRDAGLNDKFKDYTKIQIRNHGEMGPVLTLKGQHFTGPSQLTKAAPIERLSMVEAQLKSYEDVLAKGGGTDWMREQIPRLTAERDGLTAA